MIRSGLFKSGSRPWAARRRKSSRTQTVSDLIREKEHLLNENSPFFMKEAYKTLRTNVMYSITEVIDCPILMVTSALSGEGKSFTAINFAISCAQEDRRVLLIDCDLRRPKIARLLQLHNEVGLTKALFHPELARESAVETQYPNLSVVLGGAIPPNPSELLGSERMKNYLTTMRQEYDLIILDTAPVNLVTDASVLSSLCDGTVFVIRSGVSERDSVSRAMKELSYGKVKILGFVLNGAPGCSGSYHATRRPYKAYRKGYGYSYGYGYGYGYGEYGGPDEVVDME